MNDYSEKRSSFRILENLKLKYEVISDTDFMDALKRANSAGSVGSTSYRARLLDIDARLEEALYVLGRQSPSVKEALGLLNQKLEVFARALPELQQDTESLAAAVPQECELSADSLVFATDEHLPVGTKLKLRFLLISENRYFETLASVYRIAEKASDGSSKNRVVACFEGMPSGERDALFQHLFSMQSETLRMRRMSMEDAAREEEIRTGRHSISGS